jgi:hypothetical protein
MSMDRQGKKLNRAGRWSSRLVWTAFVAVVALKFLFPTERVQPGRPAPWGGDPGRRFRRPPTRVRPPVSKVPADLWRIQIEIASSDVEKLRGYYWNGWRGDRVERPEVVATVREGGTVYTNVALHLKGAAGSFRPFDDKPALTLNFSRHGANQQFHGYSKISSTIPCRIHPTSPRPFPGTVRGRRCASAPLGPRHGIDQRPRLGLCVLTEGFGKHSSNDISKMSAAISMTRIRQDITGTSSRIPAISPRTLGQLTA